MDQSDIATFGITGLLLMGLGLPLYRRWVGPNRLYGFRTPSTLNNGPLWYAVNARFGLDLIVVGLGLLVATAGRAAGALTPRGLFIGSLVWLAVGSVVAFARVTALIAKWRD